MRNFNLPEEVRAEVSALRHGRFFSRAHRNRWAARKLVARSPRIDVRIVDGQGVSRFTSVDETARDEGIPRMSATASVVRDFMNDPRQAL